MTGIVTTLERQGCIYRQAFPVDGGSFHIWLTEERWSIKSDFEEISDLLLQKVYGDMPNEYEEHLVELLAQVEKNMS